MEPKGKQHYNPNKLQNIKGQSSTSQPDEPDHNIKKQALGPNTNR